LQVSSRKISQPEAVGSDIDRDRSSTVRDRHYYSFLDNKIEGRVALAVPMVAFPRSALLLTDFFAVIRTDGSWLHESISIMTPILHI